MFTIKQGQTEQILYNQAKQAVSKLKKTDIDQILYYNNPPEQIPYIFVITFMLIYNTQNHKFQVTFTEQDKLQLKSINTKQIYDQFLSIVRPHTNSFLHLLLNFKVQNLSQIKWKSVKLVWNLMFNQNSDKKIKHTSKTCYLFHQWNKNMIKIHQLKNHQVKK